MPLTRTQQALLLGTTASLAFGCQPSLGTPNEDAAHQVVFAADGVPAYAGQALMRESCANGICHSPAAVNSSSADVRFGAPAGLDFDVRPACASGESCDADVERLRVNQRRTHNWRRSIYSQVDKGFMPPPGIGHELVSGWSSSLAYQFADGTPLPGLDSAEGKSLLRAWLATGTPVVERYMPAPAGARPGGDCSDGAVGDCIYERGADTDGGMPPPLDPSWTAIYTRLIHPLCGTRCHAAGPPDYRATTNLDLSTQRLAYDQMVDIADTGSSCSGAGLLVKPGDSANSVLVNVTSPSPSCGARMPQGGPFLTAAQLATVAQWIDAGALDN